MSTFMYPFNQMYSASKAVQALKEQGFLNARLDCPDTARSPYEDLSFQYQKSTQSLTSMVLGKNSYVYTLGKGPLTASDPYVTGLSSYESSEMHSVLVLEADESQKPFIDSIVAQFSEST